MGASPKTTEFLKECMADSLLRLMKEKPFSKITVNEIAQAAGVNRSTWFRNFDTKNEALTFKLVTLWNRWAEAHNLPERSRYTVDNTERFFEFFYQCRDVLRTMQNAGLHTAVYDAFYHVMMPQYGADKEECYRARFYAYGLYGLVDEWVTRGFRETPEEMGRIFREHIKE